MKTTTNKSLGVLSMCGQVQFARNKIICICMNVYKLLGRYTMSNPFQCLLPTSNEHSPS
jgi:hypothetical protein